MIMLTIMRHNVMGVSLLCVTLMPLQNMADSLTVGQTYAVKEENALNAIKTAASKVDWKKTFAKDKVKKAFNAQRITLPSANKSVKRHYIPYYELPKAITDAQGNTLYPAGFRFNPLDYYFMPGRVVVIGDDAQHITWLKQARRAGDQIITAGGDVRVLAQTHQITAFFFEEKMRERLGIVRVPSIVSQDGNRFLVEEIQLPKPEDGQ